MYSFLQRKKDLLFFFYKFSMCKKQKCKTVKKNNFLTIPFLLGLCPNKSFTFKTM